MPQEPKKKHSKGRKRTRRASIKLEEVGLVKCSNCQKPTIPHQVCRECGFYSGKQVKSKTAVKVVKA
ncbi:MAG: 50S ribosomal protein L32 [Candidatus Daviesbacteria bacterium]|nr:50S ribosomal protein L32 [Candidatus Daviesbacteria bacterium]